MKIIQIKNRVINLADFSNINYNARRLTIEFNEIGEDFIFRTKEETAYVFNEIISFLIDNNKTFLQLHENKSKVWNAIPKLVDCAILNLN